MRVKKSQFSNRNNTIIKIKSTTKVKVNNNNKDYVVSYKRYVIEYAK